MQNKKITIYDIAEEAGVSASQVSRALSGNGYVSAENKEKIWSVVEQYNYRPSTVARNLKKGRTNSIAFLIPHIYQEYFPYVYDSFEKEMEDKGYLTIVFNGKSTYEREVKEICLLEDLRVDAAVIIGGTLDQIDWDRHPDYVQAVKRLSGKIPCILGSDRAESMGCSGVYVDSEGCVEEMVAYLAGQGHRSMGILGGVDSVYPAVQLRERLAKYAGKHGMELRPEWQISSSFNSADGAAAMRTLLRQEELPSVVCCINDEIAVGAMGVAMDAGLRIPRDIAFTGYDGVWLGKEFRPQLTTIQMDFDTMGRRFAESVLKGLEGNHEITTVPVKPWLELRESTNYKLAL